MTRQAADNGDPKLDLCPVCGKKIADSNRVGSLTSFLFQANYCQCGVRRVQPGKTSEGDADRPFCPKCGLQIVTDSRQGSLTGFLFQSTRCKCPPDQAFADGLMSAKFWKLKQAGSGTIFNTAAGQSSRASGSSIDLAPGAIIGGAYKIIQLIGRGGMGEVYLARHETLGKKCALKVIPPEQVTEQSWLRFQLEARAVAKLEHVNLVRVTDLGIHEGCLPFYAMDYVEGQNLAEMLAERGTMPLKTMLEVFMQVCDGVECAHHSGILHRDLKPANIMLMTTRTGLKQAKVLDFGLAKLTRHDRSMQSLTAVGDIFGSPFYMSPEQCNGDKLDNRSDIYSLGCTMFECLAGRPPFSGHLAGAIMFSHLEADPPSLESIVGPGRFPASMEVVLVKLLRKNPVERYQTLLELRSDLDRVARGEDVQPFYIRRSSPVRGQTVEENSLGREGNERETRPGPSLSTSGIVVSLLVVGLLVSLAAFGTISKKRPATKFATPSEDQGRQATVKNQAVDTIGDFQQLTSRHDPDLPKALAIFALFGRIKSTIVTKDGIKQRRFVFPDWPIGEISTGGFGPIDAKGVTIVPAGKPLLLHIGPGDSRQVLSCPSIIDKIDPSEFDKLEIEGGGIGVAGSRLSQTETETSGLLYILKAAARWQKLERLRLANITLTREVFDRANDLKHLRHFAIYNTTIDAKDLSNQPFLNRLETLDIDRVGDLGNTDQFRPVCRTLANSTNLKRLSFFNCYITAQALLELRKCASLRYIQLQAMGGARLVPAITQLTSLKDVSVVKTALTPAQIRSITACKNIRRLILSKTAFSDSEMRSYSQAEPKLSFL